jgi:hypothetical protein
LVNKTKPKDMKYTTLSAYTIADNCTDASDLSYGLAELKEFVRNRKGSCALAYKRMNAIMKKLESIK